MLQDNYFALFALPLTYQLNQTDLADRYRRLQAEVHPDKHAAGSAAQKRLAMQQATQVNSAYQTLKHPVKRALYLIAQHGINLEEEASVSMTPEFLFAQMDLRERLENLPKQADPIAALEQFLAEIEQQSKALQHALQDTFKEKNWTDTEQLIRKLQFFNKLITEAIGLEESLY